MKTTKRLLAVVLILTMVWSLAACGTSMSNSSVADEQLTESNAAVSDITESIGDEALNEDSYSTEISSEVTGDTVEADINRDETSVQENTTVLTDVEDDVKEEVKSGETEAIDKTIAPKGEYNKGVVLVKVKEIFREDDLGILEYASAEPLYAGSKWYSVQLSDATKTEEAVAYLTSLEIFEGVDYDYVMSTDTSTEAVDVSCNPNYDKHKHHHTHKVPDGWKYATDNGKHPGGSSDVVIAVIDTGVDYTHLDLRNNVWVNTAEVAGNGKDDDGNGYIDDIYGWDFVGNDKEPSDDNGHGTHVAGIIAAENNTLGGVGVAYGCKVMVLKAGNSSGYFNNSDIAEAIQYAYMNGASVINMSFGGSSISIAVEEALENAYNACVLVAAAGNDGACNDVSCKKCEVVKVSYPAALPYVIGVMSTNHDGSAVSTFSNYDHNPYNAVEYEVYAVGEAVPSCWPGNKYANLNGTSMATPTVSGIAALLRSYYSDREVYSTKFIQSQIVNTGTLNPYNYLTEVTDSAHSVTNVYEALTQLPKPEVNLYNYSIDDSASISSANNGNGVMDAGETVRLYIAFHNRGGVASNVNVSIDTNRGEGLTDPYFTFVNPIMQLSDIGTYSVRESGDKYFEIVVSDDCPNDYLVNFNIRYTYTNGLDANDTAQYEDDGKQQAQFNVSSGYHLPSTISEDTTFTNDRRYIIGEDLIIPLGVTVTFEEGCEIQFYDDREYYNSPAIFVYGTLNICGTEDNMVQIYPSERYLNYAYYIVNCGQTNIDYMKSTNLFVGCDSEDAVTLVANSYLLLERGEEERYYSISKGDKTCSSILGSDSRFIECINNDLTGYYRKRQATYHGCYIDCLPAGNGFGANTIEDSIIVERSKDNIELYVKNLRNCLLLTNKESKYRNSGSIVVNNECTNNVFKAVDDSIDDLVTIKFKTKAAVANNTFSPAYQSYASQVIEDYYDTSANPTVDVYGSCSDISALPPHIVNVEIFNADGEQTLTVGKEEIKVRVTFNKAMDTTANPGVFFGTIEPYADYKIEGAYVSDTVWEGTYTLKAHIENGIQKLIVNGACAADDKTKMVHGEYQLYEFNIDTTEALSMNLFATETDHGIELTWNQDDYDTLMGYNIYRADSKDGNYVKINPSVLLPTDSSFIDDNAEPGKTYWYTFTVVLSDFSESAPAGKVCCTAVDTLEPTIYHTPVNQGYAENNLVISCTASDNMAIASVTFYYRTVGSDTWKSLAMSKVNDKYSATIFGSELTLDGIEYYIVATDGVNTVSKGTADEPYGVVIKDASSISRVGDVDGSGSVTTKDALMLMQCLNGDLLLSDDAFKRADLNGDEQLSSAEALRILQYVDGKVTSLEM